MADLIDRQAVIETAIEAADKWDGGYSSEREGIIRKFFDKVPAAQPDHVADISEINKFIDGLEEIFADIRERHVDDSVCGLCEYDGAYMGQSGDWCNECPGFDKGDCFKLSDETRKKWIEEIVNTYPDHTADIGKKVCVDTIRDMPSAQPEIIRCKDCKFSHMTNDGRYCKYCDQFTDDYGELVEMYFDSNFYCGYAEKENRWTK